MIYTDEEYQIFGRQFILKSFSESNIKKLANSKITIVGMGGIGCPVATYLISSGSGIPNLFIFNKLFVDQL